MTDRVEATSQPPITILNVNDDDAARYFVTRILSRAGFAVVEASTGAEALRRSHEGPDLVVLDVNLPDINGIEVCRRIKADPMTAALPVLHLSASRIGTRDLAQGLESGADGYLTQPVEPVVLTATVRALLRLSQAEARARSSARAWETVFGAIGDGVCLLDMDGRIVRCNPAMATLVRKPLPDIAGKFYHEILAEAFPGTSFPPDPKLPIEQRNVTEIQTAAEKERRWLRLTTEPITPEPGDPVSGGTVRIVSDVTENRESAARQRTFLRDILSSVTEGRLHLCMSAAELPERLSAVRAELALTKRTVRDLRVVMRDAAIALGFSEERWQEMETGVGEAAMNAVVHAGAGTGVVCSDGVKRLQVWVMDQGGGIEMDRLHRATLERGFSSAGTLGHGFWMMLKTCDRLYLLTGQGGTTIVLEQDVLPPEPAWLQGI